MGLNTQLGIKEMVGDVAAVVVTAVVVAAVAVVHKILISITQGRVMAASAVRVCALRQ
jgi:hypothetical protein